MIKNSCAYFFSIFILTFGSCTTPSNNVIRIAAASNMQFALVELTKAFETSSTAKTELIIASSGKLTAQIIEGAPFDIFLSADMKYPKAIFEAQRSKGSPRIYAQGQLVLWSGKKRAALKLADLLDPSVKHIALANPINAPYGKAAMECLAHHQMDTQIKDRLVYGESIAQVNQFISTGASEIGFTSKSVVMSPNIKSKGSWIDLPKTSYSSVDQGVVLIDKKKENNPKALEFYNFLFTKEAQQILKDFGYLGIKN